MVKFLNNIICLVSVIAISSCCSTGLNKQEKLTIDEEFNANIHFTQEKAIRASVIEIKGIEGKVAVFGENSTATLSIHNIDRTFTPTTKEILEAEKFLIKKYSNTNDNSILNYKNEVYNRRQYIGVFKNDKKQLLINLFVVNNKCLNKSYKNYVFDKVFVKTHHTENPEMFEIFDLK